MSALGLIEIQFQRQETCVSDVFQEVEEEFRREQLEKLWKKYRIPVIGAAVSLVLAVAGYQGWTYWRGVQLGNSSVALDASFRRAEADDQKAAIESLKKVAETGAGGYAILGKFQLAALTAKSGDKKAAVAAYADIAKSTSDPLFRDLAIVRSSLLTAETAKFEETKAQLELDPDGNIKQIAACDRITPAIIATVRKKSIVWQGKTYDELSAFGLERALRALGIK